MAQTQDMPTVESKQTFDIGKRHALFGGLLAGLAVLGAYLAFGGIYADVQAHRLLGELRPTLRYYSGSVMGASVTLLSLMLTMLGITNNVNMRFDRKFYERIKYIGIVSAFAFLGALAIFILLSFPAEQQNDTIGQAWFRFNYFALVIMTSVVSGTFVMIAMLLVDTIRNVVHVLMPDD